jgi:3-oxoacyl-[acyl-carrier protein] reductase
MRLDGKVAIVTGGASGFGAGIVRKFCKEGAKVMIADLNHDLAQSLADELGDDVAAHKVNVGTDEQVKELVETCIKVFGGINILVNNAGITHKPGPMEEVDEDKFDLVFNVNAKSVYLTARYIVPLMKSNGGGAILNIASTGAVSPRPNLTWYNASKGWITSATRGMAIELASCGIRVNAINPVAGDTPLLKSFMGEDTPEIRQKFLSTIPIGRFSTPEDIGNAACYLCSDEASMVTGVCLEVDGGRCI